MKTDDELCAFVLPLAFGADGSAVQLDDGTADG